MKTHPAKFVLAMKTGMIQEVKKTFYNLSRDFHNHSVRLTMGTSRLSAMIPDEIAQVPGRIIGDMAYLLEDFWEKPAWRICGPDLRIMFVGHRISLSEIMPLFFKEPMVPELVDDSIRCGLGRKARRWLAGDIDLVIYELSRLYPVRLRSACLFTVPQWVNQQIAYPEQMSAFLSGNRFDGLRNHINRARKTGVTWRFSRSREDFDFFYRRLYLPFVQARHGQWAHVAPYPFQWDLWIQDAGGGLILVTHEGEVIAGAIALVAADVCYNIESGILDARSDLLARGINAYLCWVVAQWGRERGARFYNMGGSLGWRCNGAFAWKAKWGTQVIPRKIPYRQLNFIADRVSPSLQARLNEIGFVCRRKGGFYSLMIAKNDERSIGWNQLSESIKRARKEGLCGICVVTPGAGPRWYDSEAACF